MSDLGKAIAAVVVALLATGLAAGLLMAILGIGPSGGVA